MLDCPVPNKECVQQTCCGVRQLKELKNGSKNSDQSLEASQLLLTNKKSNSKLDKLDNNSTVIDMIEQPGKQQSEDDDKLKDREI